MNATTNSPIDAVDRTTSESAESIVGDRHIDSVEQLMAFAEEGLMPKAVLVELLNIDSRYAYRDACAVIEKKYTADCTAADDPCLESGCALEGEICLQPLLRAGIEYHKRCGREWTKFFADPCHRIDAWRH